MNTTSSHLYHKSLLLFDVAALIVFSLAYVYYTTYYQPDLLTNKEILFWESSNTRPLVFLYIFIIFFVTTRLTLINALGPGLSIPVNSTNSRTGATAHWALKTVLLGIFAYITFACVFLPYFNDGYGSTHVESGLDVHMTSQLAPLAQHILHGKPFYLETPIQYAPGTLYLQGMLADIFSLSLADAYRSQLLVNLISFVIFCGFIICLTGPLTGCAIIIFAFTPFSILNNFHSPGWGFLHRWLAIPVFSLVLSRIVTRDSSVALQYLLLAGMSIVWAVLALIGQENFSGGLICFSLVFFLLLRYRRDSLQSYATRYLFFVSTFAFTFCALVVLLFGIDQFRDFFGLYTDYSGRVFAGASSYFFTDLNKLAHHPPEQIVVGILFLGIAILVGAVHLVSTVQSHRFYLRDVGIFVAVTASAISLNLISYIRSDWIHIQSASFMMLPLFATYVLFYFLWIGERTTYTTMIAFFAVFLCIAALWGSEAQARQYLARLFTPPDITYITRWLSERPSDNTDLPGLSIFGIDPDDHERERAYRSVLGRYSSEPEEQSWAIRNYPEKIALLSEIQLALRGRQVIPKDLTDIPLDSESKYDPYITRSGVDLFLTGLKSATATTSIMTTVWNKADYLKWRSDAREGDNQCIGVANSRNLGWLAEPNVLAEVGIEVITTEETFSGETASFICRCSQSASNPGCISVRTYLEQHLDQVSIDFSSLQAALEKYFSDNGHYPVSSEQGLVWDGLHSISGELTRSWIRVSPHEWISGIVPDYIAALPQDTRGGRNGGNGGTDYIYRSNGKAFRLEVRDPLPVSCEIASTQYPAIYNPIPVDPGCRITVYSTGADHW